MDTDAIQGRIGLLTKLLLEELEQGKQLDLKPVNLKVAYHAPCHLEHMGDRLSLVKTRGQVYV